MFEHMKPVSGSLHYPNQHDYVGFICRISFCPRLVGRRVCRRAAVREVRVDPHRVDSLPHDGRRALHGRNTTRTRPPGQPHAAGSFLEAQRDGAASLHRNRLKICMCVCVISSSGAFLWSLLLPVTISRTEVSLESTLLLCVWVYKTKIAGSWLFFQ